MDMRALLQEACGRARISKADLARRAGTDPSLLSAWATGRVSPTVASLARVLAAVDLQLRPSLEPLLADLDARVDEVLGGHVVLDLPQLGSLAAHAGVEQSWSVELPDGSFGRAQGTVTWAFDGATALALQGLAFPQDVRAICLLLDDAARCWLSRGFVIAPGHDRLSFWDATFEQARDHLRGLSAGRYGMHLIRLVEEMPAVVRLQPPGTDEVFPVLAVDAVGHAHPALGEVLARLRTRRSLPA
ncbi:MAG TPA: helix-turn-helix transcriptional regulator [Mycobacteriales bacterium]|nr:helix-turn-helix transcriptional regulator [Mycobacteriales bacterium]